MAVKPTSFISLIGVVMLMIFSGVISKPITKPHLNGDGSDLQKSVVKTIQTDSGDMFDCIDFYEQPSLKHPSLKNHNFHPQFALGETIRNAGVNHYNGAGASLSVYSPKVSSNQYSSTEIIIQNDSDMIEVGWTVNPHMYKDAEARIFVSTIAGKTHCFNAYCGFVIVNKDFPMGDKLIPVSVAGGVHTYTYSMFVYKDSESGNWWLKVGEAGIIVGFWPKQFFTGLASPATYIACGGEVYRPSWETSGGLPEMGSGYRASTRLRTMEAYCGDFVMVDEAHQVLRASGTQPFASNEDYTVIDNHKRDWPEHFVFYGGPLNNY